MSEASVFRTAAPTPTTTDAKPVTHGDETPGTGSVVDVSNLFATYEIDQKRPYTSDYFGVESVWDKEPALARDLKEIEGYVRDQVKKGDVANDTKAASKFMKEMERKAGLTGYESESQRIQKILAYVDFKRVVDGSKKL